MNQQPSDLFRRIVIEGEGVELREPDAETLASIMERIRRRRRVRVALRVLAVLLLILAAAVALVCGEESRDYAVLVTTGYGSRCPKTAVYGHFESRGDAERWVERQKAARHRNSDWTDRWTVLPYHGR